jgi:hypothetical protein
MTAVRLRELAEDIGWLVLVVLLLPLAIPLGALTAVFLLGEHLYRGSRRRMRRRGVAV